MIDFHCHIDLYPDPRSILQAARDARIYVLAVTTLPAAWEGLSSITQGFARVRLAAGIHPELAHTPHADVDRLAALLPETRYIGEVGLDGGPQLREHLSTQRDVFLRVLQASRTAGGRIMSIHSRAAVSDVLDCLLQVPDAGTPVFHWFSGSPSELARASDAGAWFSVGPKMLASKRGQDLVRLMPRDRILTESDGPFVQIGSRPAAPTDTTALVPALSDIWEMPVPDARSQLLGNFRSLVG
jgi:TatD DNase family protein